MSHKKDISSLWNLFVVRHDISKMQFKDETNCNCDETEPFYDTTQTTKHKKYNHHFMNF